MTKKEPNRSGAQNERPWSEHSEHTGSERTGSEPTAQFELPGELVQHEEHDGIDVRVPSGELEPAAPAARKTVAVPSSVARWVVLALFLLLVLVAGLMYAILKPAGSTGTVAVGATASPSASTAGATGSASAGALPSPSAAGNGSAGASTAGASTSPQSSGTGAASPNTAFTPINGTAPLGPPVDNGDGVSLNVDVMISNVDYPNSVTLNCANSATTDWNVDGHSFFTTTLGIPDTAPGATGSTITMTFANENGQPLGVAKTSIGQPANVRIPLTGVHRLATSCTRQSTNGYGYNQYYSTRS